MATQPKTRSCRLRNDAPRGRVAVSGNLHAPSHRRRREVQAGEGPGAVAEDELVDALGGQELEPAREHGVVRIDGLHEAACETDEGEGPRVRAKGGRDGFPKRRARRRRGAGEGVGVDEDERRGAPETSPARGERGGAGPVLDGEAGDDAEEDVVGEAADMAYSVAVFGILSGGAGEGRRGEGGVEEAEHRVLPAVQRLRVQPVAPLHGRVVVQCAWLKHGHGQGK